MNPHYAEIWKDLQAYSALEKTASLGDEELARWAAAKEADHCDCVFEKVKKRAAPDGGTKEEVAAKVASFAASLRSTHVTLGEKVASDGQAHLENLKVAAFVDEVLTAQLKVASESERAEIRQVQLLGREYAVHLMRGLLA